VPLLGRSIRCAGDCGTANRAVVGMGRLSDSLVRDRAASAQLSSPVSEQPNRPTDSHRLFGSPEPTPDHHGMRGGTVSPRREAETRAEPAAPAFTTLTAVMAVRK